MKITNILLAAILAVALPFSAVAVADPDEDIAKALNLDQDRAQQVEVIMDNYDDRRDEVKERAHDDMKKLKEEKKQKLEAVLSEDEMEQLEAMHEAKKDKHRKDCMDDDKKWDDK